MLQNLLSKQSKKSTAQEYYLRLVTVCMALLSLAVVVGLIALLPAYMSVVGELNAAEAIQLAKEQDTHDTAELLAEVEQGEYMVTFLEKDLQKERLTDLLREALRERPEGISMYGFSYSRVNRQLTLDGLATKRELVVPYARALEANSYFETVPVSIADLAKNTNLEFHLSLTVADGERQEQ